MGKSLHKSLLTYLSKLRRPGSADPPRDDSTTTSWLLSACRYPKTPSFAADRQHPAAHESGGRAATLSDVDRFLFENFNSLYGSQGDEDYVGDDCSLPPPMDAGPNPEIRASPRFFVSPGTSNSLVEEARQGAASSTSSSSSATSPSSSATVTQPLGDVNPAVVPGDAVTVMTFSKDPYEDFRRSMQEMVESRHGDPREPVDWDFMEELLFCYLQLNDRSVHKDVLGAFSDLAVNLRRRKSSSGTGRKIPEAGVGRRRRTPADEEEERGGSVTSLSGRRRLDPTADGN